MSIFRAKGLNHPIAVDMRDGSHREMF